MSRVGVTKLCANSYVQETLFNFEKSEKQRKLNKTLDELRKKYGKECVVKSTFLHLGINPLNGEA